MLDVLDSILNNHSGVIVRSLNLSYNSLYFSDKKGIGNTSSRFEKEIQQSEEFIDIFTQKFIKEAKLMNHLDLSGMGFTESSLSRLSLGLVKSNLLAAVHFNDNGFFEDREGKLAIMDIFGIDEASLDQNISHNHTFNKEVSNP